MAPTKAARKPPRNRSSGHSRKPSPEAKDTSPAVPPSAPSSSATASLDEPWQEPPLPPPKPSYLEDLNVPFQAVLEHMQPLGQLPNIKVRQRMKHLDSKGRASQAKKSGSPVPEDDAKADYPPGRRRSQTKKVEEAATLLKVQDARLTNGASVSVEATPAPGGEDLVATTAKEEEDAHNKLMREVAEKSVVRSRERGDVMTGLALRKVFEESRDDPVMCAAVDAVFARNPTPEQTKLFQTQIFLAKKRITAEEIAAESDATILRSEQRSLDEISVNNSAKSAPSSKQLLDSPATKFPDVPPAKSTRSARSRAETPSNAVETISTSRTRRSLKSRQATPSHTTDIIPSIEKRTAEEMADADDPTSLPSAKRLKQAGSPLSTSSLSSIPSDDPVMQMEQEASKHKRVSAKGPKLHIFATSSTNSKKRPAGNRDSTAPGTPAIVEDLVDAERAEKKRKLLKNFDHVPVSTSNERTSVVRHQPRPHRKSSEREIRPSSSGSLSSSIDGDFLVAPPSAALRTSRGLTPNGVTKSRTHGKREPKFKVS